MLNFGGMDLGIYQLKGKNYFYIVGIDQYIVMFEFYNVCMDVEKIKLVLEEKYQFDVDFIYCYFDEEVMQANIIQYFWGLVDVVGEDDNFLMYFVGYGEYDKVLDVGYWIFYDVCKNYIGFYILFDLIMCLICVIKSKYIFIIMDFCYLGSIFI